jgi:hypothetical protein
MNFPKSVVGAYLFIGSIPRGGGAIFEGFFFTCTTNPKYTIM